MHNKYEFKNILLLNFLPKLNDWFVRLEDYFIL